MTTSIILVAYEGDRWLPTCISSLRNASRRQLHLILIDNAGNTIIDQLDLSGFDAEILETPKPMGFAEANNFALITAERLERTVLFLNQDTISTPGWIDTCLECLEDNLELAAVSPLITRYDERGWDPSFLDCVGSAAELEKLLTRETGGCFLTKNAPAPALLVRTDVLRQTGPFDPIYGSYYEDYDLCRRIRESGFSIGFSRKARLAHYSGSTTDTPSRERRRMGRIIRNRLIYRLRESDEPRGRVLVRHVFLDTPRRLARGLLRTESSQPPHVTIAANVDLLKILPRLVSERRDRAAWKAYLDSLRWHDRMEEAELQAGN